MLKMICTSIQRKSASNPCDAPRAMLFSILFARNGPRMPSRRYSMSRRVASRRSNDTTKKQWLDRSEARMPEH